MPTCIPAHDFSNSHTHTHTLSNYRKPHRFLIKTDAHLPGRLPDMTHRRSQGVHWVHMHPQGGEKILFWAKFTGKCWKCTPMQSMHPRGRARVQFFWRNWDLDGGRGYLGSFSVFWGRRLKKRSSTFSGKKSAPSDKILATPMSWEKKCTGPIFNRTSAKNWL